MKITTNISDLKLPKKLVLKPKAVEHIAELVRLGIERNLLEGKDIRGNAVAPNKTGTRIFVRTGELLGSVMKDVTDKRAEVFIAPGRSEVMYHLNTGNKNMPKREAFGYSVWSDKEIDKWIKETPIEELFEGFE